MAKAPPPSRNQMTKGSSKSFSKSDGSGIVSRRSKDPVTPGPRNGSEPPNRVVKSRSTQTSSPPAGTMSPKAQDKIDIRQACDKILDRAENEIQRLKQEVERLSTEKNEQARDSSQLNQLIHQLRAEKGHVADQLRQSVTNTESAITRCQKLESEASQLKQQLHDAQHNQRDYVAWSEVQPIISRIRGFFSTGNTMRDELQALENRYMGKQLPGDEVVQDSWSNPNVSFGMLDPSVLSGFPVTNNFALSTPQVPPLPGQYPTLS